MERVADWYFDYISPYPYLQLARFSEPPGDLVIRPRPALFERPADARAKEVTPAAQGRRSERAGEGGSAGRDTRVR